jgi:hypothetical protein
MRVMMVRIRNYQVVVNLLEAARKEKDATIARHMCIYVLSRYNMHSAAYKNLYQVYKLALILPVTQVFCERTFSKLKLSKTRLRSTLSADHLESLLPTIYGGKRLLDSFSMDNIILIMWRNFYLNIKDNYCGEA